MEMDDEHPDLALLVHLGSERDGSESALYILSGRVVLAPFTRLTLYHPTAIFT